jgi:molybdate transport system substrate-binding protein
MKRMLTAVAAIVLLCSPAARAAEVTLIAPGGIRAAIQDLIPGFEQKTGHTVKASFGSGGGTHDQVVKGDPFDVPVVQPPYDDVIKSGNVVPASETPLATVAVGLAARTGAPHPDISTPEAVKKLFLSAKSISYPNSASGAAAGVTMNEAMQKLGIADAMKAKYVQAQGGAGAMALLAKGEVEIGLTFISEIITEPGVEVVGPLPREIATPTALVAFLSSHAKQPDAAKALIAYLSGPEAASVYKKRGMQPGK